MEVVVLEGLKAIVLILLFRNQAEFQAPLLKVPFLKSGLSLSALRYWVYLGLNIASGEIVSFLERCSFQNPFFDRLLANDVLFNDSFDPVG